MKKMIFTVFLCSSIFSFASNSKEKINLSKRKGYKNGTLENKNLKKRSISTLITVTCSVTIEGENGESITYTSSAGNWFSTLEGATSRCAKKLEHLGFPDNFNIQP